MFEYCTTARECSCAWRASLDCQRLTERMWNARLSEAKSLSSVSYHQCRWSWSLKKKIQVWRISAINVSLHRCHYHPTPTFLILMSISEGSPSTTITYLTDPPEHQSSQTSLYPTSLNLSIFFSHPTGPAPVYRQFTGLSEVLVHGVSFNCIFFWYSINSISI